MKAGVIACCLALVLGVAAFVGQARAAHEVSSMLVIKRAAAGHAGHSQRRTEMLAIRSSLATCEARLEKQPRRVPTLAIVGASFTAGVGPDNPELSWAVLLARRLRWNAVIYGVPGAGYLNPGDDGRGPVSRMLTAEQLHGLHPSVVIIQAGHNDVGWAPAREKRQVRATVDQIRSQAPKARIALIAVFTRAGLTATPALRTIDHAIVTAGKSADSRIIIMDPLTGRWAFPRAHDGLHPSAAGDAWIAHKVATVLFAHGVKPASVDATVPVICDVAIDVTKDSADSDRDA
jgi:lysophospholipase L1-like esterase